MAKQAPIVVETDVKPELPVHVVPGTNVFRKVVRVENNTARCIILPPTQHFPSGFTLKPGMHTPLTVDVVEDDETMAVVPVQYFDDLFSMKVKNAYGKEVYPGRRTIADLEKPTKIVTPKGERIGPQITIYSVDQSRPDGITPESLDEYWKPYRDEQDMERNVALDMLAVIHDRAALSKYAKNSRHGAIKQAAQAKLGASHGTY